jgi:polysaccharide biosynthesis/export protein
MTRQKLAVLATALTVIGASAFAQKPKDPPPPVDSGRVAAPLVPSSVNPDAPGLAVDPKTFVIGAEDILKISVWREPDLSGAVGVRPDGMISRPLIGDLQAAGLTPERLARQLHDAYAEKIRNPEITIEVIQVNSRHYSIAGEVIRAGMFPLVVPLSVFDALNLAGGFKEFAKRSNVAILHADGTMSHFNWEKYSKGDKKEHDKNIMLAPGDTIIVK